MYTSPVDEDFSENVLCNKCISELSQESRPLVYSPRRLRRPRDAMQFCGQWGSYLHVGTRGSQLLESDRLCSLASTKI
jgi:hypothetical protein